MAARKDYQNRKAASAVAEAAVDKEVILTVGGKPIPPEVAHLIPYANTDQGIAEANAAAIAAGKIDPTMPRVYVGDGPFEKGLQEHEDSIQPWSSTDPIALAKRRIHNPDQKHCHLFSGNQSHQAARDAGFVIERDRETGEPIRIANMTLGSMPLKRWEEREAHYTEANEGSFTSAVNNFVEETNKLAFDAGQRGQSATGHKTPERRIGNAGEILTGV